MLKSYDWRDGAGDLYLNPRGVRRVALDHERAGSLSGVTPRGDRGDAPRGSTRPHQWRARFASLTFNQYGRGFPNGGINEAGVAVEVLWLNESRAPAPDTRPYLNELEWIQYVLDTSERAEDALKASETLRISPLYGQVHYLICDRSGSCFTLELLEGEVVTHSGDQLPYPALTNHTYQDSISYVRASKRAPAPSERGSLARFSVATRALAEPQPQTLENALKALKRVEISGYTKWQIAYDLKKLEIVFKTSSRRDPRRVSLATLLQRSPQRGRGCSAMLTYPLSAKARGDISALFKAPKVEDEQRSLRPRYRRLKLGGPLVDAVVAHGARCVDVDESTP